MNACPGEETVDAFVAGRLTLEHRRTIEEHIDGCASCHDLIARVLSRMSEPTAGGPSARAFTGGQRGGPVLTRGQRLGRYLILADAGAGGMGTVYAAYDTLLDRKIALKFLIGSHSSQTAMARVLAEAGAMARLSHPNVVTVHDVGLLEGMPYLSMELVEGTNLSGWRREQPRSFREIGRVMAAAARGLAAAHAAGIVHRDVKPHNILVAGARVLVTDFGLSVRTEGEAEGTVAGTPAYMAPEQFRGERVDRRTDVFGFCATLYEMIHGETPFAGSSLEQIRAEVTAGRVSPPPPSSRAPARLHRLALRGLEPDPARRPADLEGLADELLADPAARWRRAGLLGTAAAVVVAAFWGGGYLNASPERQCRAGAAAIAGVWNEGRRAELRQRYQAAGQADSWPLLERRLDALTGGWRDTYGETCGATYGKRVQSDAVFAMRVQCLQGQRATLEALVTGLAAATPAELARAASAPLPTAGECEIAGRPETKPLPGDVPARQRIASVQELLGRSTAEQLLGRNDAAATSAAGAVEAARKVGYEPLLASALVRLGTAQHRRADAAAGLEGAAKTLEEAYAVAEVGRDDRDRLAAAREQIIVALERGQTAEAELWARLGEALLSRLGSPPAEAAALAQNVGWLERALGHAKEAAASFAKAAELGKKIDPPEPRRVAAALASPCADVAGAEQAACLGRAREQLAAAFGPQHPEVARYPLDLTAVLGDVRPRTPPQAAEGALSRRP